jgi:3-keto-disaccharide hydrolase
LLLHVLLSFSNSFYSKNNSMLKIYVIACTAIIISACNSQNNTNNTDTMQADSTKTARPDNDWISLFDGKTTKGWHKYGGGPVGAAWKIADGTLYLDTTVKADWQVKNGGDIVTDDEFENFDLKLEWKISKNGNSGIMFYVHEDSVKYKYPWNTGPEMQVLDNEGHPDGKIHKHRAGDLYDLIASSKEPVKPYDQWNQVEIKALNGKLDLFLNGENVVSTTMWDDNWKKLIAGSKFSTMPGFGTFKKGRIALQDHGNEVWFRNIMIKKL